MKHLVIVALVIVALVATGCTAVIDTPLPAQAPPGDPPGTAAVMTPDPVPTETPQPMSTYMYSTTRGLKYHEAGFVCTSHDETYISGPEGLIGIWCEY